MGGIYNIDTAYLFLKAELELALQASSCNPSISISINIVFLSEVSFQLCAVWLDVWMGIAFDSVGFDLQQRR